MHRVSHARTLILATSLLLAMGAVVPAHAADADNKCQLGLIETLPISLSGRGLQPTIDGSINGVPTKVQFDIGHFSSHIELSVLERMGISVRNRFETSRGVGGLAQIYKVRIKEMKVGPSKGGGEFDVFDNQDDTIGASVGSDFLLRSDLEISLAQSYLKFFQTRNCKDRHLAYWDNNAVAVPFRIESQYNARPIFKVKINGVEMEALMSSSDSSAISTRAAKRIGITPESPGVERDGVSHGIGNSIQRHWSVPIATLEVGDEKISNFKLGMVDLANVSDVVLGRDFVRAHRIYISMSQQIIYLSHTGDEIFAKTYSSEEPWFKAELDRGNPEAQYSIGQYEEAAAQGHRGASIKLAQKKFLAGDYEGSLKFIRQAQARRPSYVLSAWTYLATARSGDIAKAATQLKADRAIEKTENWSMHISDFYLGKLDAVKLRKLALADDVSAEPLCMADFHIAQSHLLAGQKDLAKPLLQSSKDKCGRSSWEYGVAVADLDLLEK